MRETLHIRLPDWNQPQSEGGATSVESFVVAYAITSTEPPVSVLVRQAPLGEVLDQASGKIIRLYAPAQDVRLLTAAVPAKQANKAAMAVPYALEDQFAEDVETLHFAIAGLPQPNGEWPVAVVADQHMRDWLSPFNARGLVPDALIPETLALPWREDGRWTVLAEPGHITVRTGPTSGFGCLEEDLELFLGLAEGDSKQALRILITQGVDADFTKLERDVELLPGLSHPLEALARHYRAAQSINLLQGAFALRRAMAREWQAWKLPTALLAGVFALAVIGNGVTALALKSQVAAQEKANEERFRALFPAEQRIVNLRVQAEQQFTALQGGARGAGLLSLIDAFAGGLKAAPTLQVEGMQYREGALFLSLSGTDLSALDQLKTHFANGHGGAKLDVQSANSGDGGVQVRIKLSPA
ncbi:MAG: type II secretion system protein GspL [Stagnimonas sp.]|nr:type II secretion system protein GspL [Stagnimonas sp.]